VKIRFGGGPGDRKHDYYFIWPKLHTDTGNYKYPHITELLFACITAVTSDYRQLPSLRRTGKFYNVGLRINVTPASRGQRFSENDIHPPLFDRKFLWAISVSYEILKYPAQLVLKARSHCLGHLIDY